VNNKKVVLLAICFLIGCVFFLRPSDEKKIMKNLNSLAEYCSVTRKESVLETLQKSALAAKLSTNPCKVQIASLKLDGELSHKQITDHILLLKKRLPDTSFIFQDTTIEIPVEDKAQVTTTLQLSSASENENFQDAYELDITVEKIDGDWRFSSYTVVEFMKK